MNEARWRHEITAEAADALLARVNAMDLARLRPAALYPTATAIARELGLAKSYDAEFLALARIRRCRVATADERLLRGAARTASRSASGS